MWFRGVGKRRWLFWWDTGALSSNFSSCHPGRIYVSQRRACAQRCLSVRGLLRAPTAQTLQRLCLQVFPPDNGLCWLTIPAALSYLVYLHSLMI